MRFLQKFDLGLGLAIALALFLITSAQSAAPTPLEIRALLKAGDLKKLEMMRKSASGAEKIFLEALFQPDGVLALQLYQEIWDNYSDNPLRWDALERIWQYHYALGYYSRAAELQKILAQRPPSAVEYSPPPTSSPSQPSPAPVPQQQSSPPPPQERPAAAQFWVQCGAYSLGENAVVLGAQLRKLGYKVSILNKIPGERKYFLVRVGGYSSLPQAESAAAEINKKLNIDARVISENP